MEAVQTKAPDAVASADDASSPPKVEPPLVTGRFWINLPAAHRDDTTTGKLVKTPRKISATWKDTKRAACEWMVGRTYTLELDVPPGRQRSHLHTDSFRVLNSWQEPG